MADEYVAIARKSQLHYEQACTLRRLNSTKGRRAAVRYARTFTHSMYQARVAVNNALKAKVPEWRGRTYIGYSHGRGNHVAIRG